MSLRDYLSDTNVQAFLRVIREGETTQDDDKAYRMMFGGSLFSSFSDHPRQKITIGSLTSTAAGAYQFLSRTWDGLVKQYGFTDFSPANQDLGAVVLIKGRKALEDVLAGRLEKAIQKCNKEWASLPGSPYGQPVITLERARKVYLAWGGREVASGSLQASKGPLKPSESLPVNKETTMEPLSFTVLALNALSKAIPLIRDFFGSDQSEVSKRNLAAAEKVVEIAKDTLGAKNEQELISSITNNPEAIREIEQALKSQWYEITEIGGGIEKAREHNLEMTKQTVPLWKQPALIVTSMLLPLVYVTVYAVLFTSGFSSEVQSMVVASVVSGILGAVTGFWLGTSYSSQKKDDALLKR